MSKFEIMNVSYHKSYVMVQRVISRNIALSNGAVYKDTNRSLTTTVNKLFTPEYE